MKKILIIIVAAVALAACSSPKYTYYFDQQQFNAANELTKSSEGIVKPDENSVTASSQPGLADETFSSLPTVAPVAEATLTEQPKTNIATKHTLTEDTRSIASVKEIKKDKKKRAIRTRKADSESSFAIAGFVCSLVSLFVLWPLSIPGVIFSALGLKSARRGLAIAGLIIGIVALVLVLAAL
jgi:hypothetical protein